MPMSASRVEACPVLTKRLVLARLAERNENTVTT